MTGILTQWKDPQSEFRKFYASVFMVQFSKMVDRKLFEAVTEGYLNLLDPSSPQVELVVYNKTKDYVPAVVVDFINGGITNDYAETLQLFMCEYAIKECFLYNIERDEWLRFLAPATMVKDDFSAILNIRLSEVLNTGLNIYRTDKSA